MVLRNPSKHDVCSIPLFLTNAGTAHVWFCTWLFSHLEPLHLPSEGAFSSSLLSVLQPVVGMSQSQP